jgi:hypothetical protein
LLFLAGGPQGREADFVRERSGADVAGIIWAIGGRAGLPSAGRAASRAQIASLLTLTTLTSGAPMLNRPSQWVRTSAISS